jgi:hypothetical protein
VPAAVGMIVSTVPTRYLDSAFTPIAPALAYLTLWKSGPRADSLLLAARRMAHALNALDALKQEELSPTNGDQWTADREFLIGIMSCRASIDNCCHSLVETLGLTVDRRTSIDISKQEFRDRVRRDPTQSVAALAPRLDAIADELGPLTAYRHALAHRVPPMVVHFQDTGRLVVTEDPDALDSISHFLDLPTGVIQSVVPVVEVIDVAVALARRMLVVSALVAVAKAEAAGVTHPRQPTAAEAGRALVWLSRDPEGPAVRGIWAEWGRKVSKLHPPAESALSLTAALDD